MYTYSNINHVQAIRRSTYIYYVGADSDSFPYHNTTVVLRARIMDTLTLKYSSTIAVY